MVYDQRVTTVTDLERPLKRVMNRRAVLQEVLDAGTTTRVALATRTGLSRPTVNAIMADLEREGLVAEVGSAASSGRAAALFRIAAQARTVVGIDLGSAVIRASVADLTGRVVAARDVPTRGESQLVDRIVGVVRQLLDEAAVPQGSLASIAVGVPGAPNLITGRIEYAFSVPELAEIDLRYQLSNQFGVPVTLDNDVNMAIIGERWRGRAQHAQNAVYIAVGNGLGVGILAGGHLQRGHSGLSGEVDAVPVQRLPQHAALPAFSLERAVTSRGIAEAYAPHAGEEGDLRAIFAEAAAGSPRAIRAVDQSAWYLAEIIATLQAVLDPERVIMGGGIGSHPILLQLLSAHLDRLPRRPPLVEATALEGRASLVGAIAVALADAREGIGLDPLRTLAL